MVEEVELTNEEIIELFNKFTYMDLENLENVMAYYSEKYSSLVVKVDEIKNNKTATRYDDTIDINTLTGKELIFIYNIISDVEHKLSSIREFIDYSELIEKLSNMEMYLYNRIFSIDGKKLIYA